MDGACDLQELAACSLLSVQTEIRRMRQKIVTGTEEQGSLKYLQNLSLANYKILCNIYNI
jgi:hypothetical protein